MASITLVGIDVSKDHLDVFIDLADGPRRLKLSNDASGIRFLKRTLGKQSCIVAVEATGRYEALVRHELEACGHDVRVQNPRMVRRLAEGLGVQAKTDPIDAQLLARTAELCAPSEPRSREREALGDLSRTIASLKKERVAHGKRIASPGFCTAATKALQRLIKAIDKEIALLEKAFEQEVVKTRMAQAYQLCQSVPGVGRALARVSICELPERLDAWSPRQIASYAGLAPLDNSSGKRHSASRLGRHGNMHIKGALYMPALALVSKDTWARSLYRRLRAKGLTHQQAVVAVMRKLLLQLVAVLKRGTAWQAVLPQTT